MFTDRLKHCFACLVLVAAAPGCSTDILGCGGQPGLAAQREYGGAPPRPDAGPHIMAGAGGVEADLTLLVREALRDDRNLPTPEPPLKFAAGVSAKTNDSWRLSQPEAMEERMAKLPGLHEASCRGDVDARRVAVVRADLDAEGDGSELIAASYVDGIVVLDDKGNVVARGNPLGDCFGKPTLLESITGVQLLDDPDRELVVVTEEGRRGISFRTLSIFKRRGRRLARIFTGMVTDSQEKSAGYVEITGPGRLTYLGPGPVRPRTFAWDADSFMLVEKQ